MTLSRISCNSPEKIAHILRKIDGLFIILKVTEKRHLKYYVTMAGPDLLCVSNSAHSREILKRIEREATFTYQTLTLSEENAANVLHINGHLVHRSIEEIPLSYQTLSERIDMPRQVLNFSELGKYSSGKICTLINMMNFDGWIQRSFVFSHTGLTSCCILIKRSRYIRNL
jgi:dimethylargininase